ncbi:MAG TPA: SRPBCC family protein [Acidobacteriaceae bacterium]|jgi:hypothetical protein|nr:SRPBCC family protein [Acidobacteriaceae bacterium]
MASIRKEITVKASVDQVWGAIRDIGALHTPLVPGFVVDTKLETDARIVTFANGHVVRERIVTIDDSARRLVWECGPCATREKTIRSPFRAAPCTIFCGNNLCVRTTNGS